MTNSDVNEFIECLYEEDDIGTLFEYKGRGFALDQRREGGKAKLFLTEMYADLYDYIWMSIADTHAENVQAFLNVPLWDGRMFLEAESEMRWL